MDPCEAWREAVDIYQKFRQGVGFARDGGKNGNTPGRSRWPEPDAIRRRTRRHSRYHVPKHEVQDGFPRADLGLPIIFHFKDERDGDPGDFNVSGPETGRTRFASPVITKALACEDGRYRAMVLVLNAPHVWELGDLSVTTGRPVGRAQIELTPEERRNVAPLEGLTVREALTSFVAKEWKAEPEVIA
jgi:CRISPR-associated protein Cmr1